MGRHTILLIQYNSNKQSRTFMDYESVSECVGGVVQLYEQKLKQLNPNLSRITYDITDLYNYLDSLPDISCLVYNPAITGYSPFNRHWIKQRVFEHLRRQSQSPLV
eukprot:gnl/Spiro4/15280_TR8201_c0_g1_i1.p2 gnl/Spiro4/15280_TR8201_c0_g1~~gnl/Spiro4/15280_TR8201_c0_g1_i1.p2  ORF type:complete len:116 (+),score=14.74 gnl/Spiro4/15280_TR8201_c0_g1_i1:32-349(+)